MLHIKKEYTDYVYKSLRLPTELVKKVQLLANENGTSFNKVVIQCIEYALVESDDNTTTSQ